MKHSHPMSIPPEPTARLNTGHLSVAVLGLKQDITCTRPVGTNELFELHSWIIKRFNGLVYSQPSLSVVPHTLCPPPSSLPPSLPPTTTTLCGATHTMLPPLPPSLATHHHHHYYSLWCTLPSPRISPSSPTSPSQPCPSQPRPL
jgi:hypothetical protein